MLHFLFLSSRRRYYGTDYQKTHQRPWKRNHTFYRNADGNIRSSPIIDKGGSWAQQDIHHIHYGVCDKPDIIICSQHAECVSYMNGCGISTGHRDLDLQICKWHVAKRCQNRCLRKFYYRLILLFHNDDFLSLMTAPILSPKWSCRNVQLFNF